MNKCGTKTRNPCKICLQPVTNKNGLQCQGACKKWAHFTCLNYTPGKIQDIKTGHIKVTCPCPGCNTTEPKEFLINPPFTCTNRECAANKTPQCDTPECPSNKPKPIPAVPEVIQTIIKNRQAVQSNASNNPSVRTLSSCPLCPPYTPCPPCPPTPICPNTPPNSSPPVESAAVRGTPHHSKVPTQQVASRPASCGVNCEGLHISTRPPSKPPPTISSPTGSASSAQLDSCDSSPEPIGTASPTPSQYESPHPPPCALSSQRPQTISEPAAKNKAKMHPQRSQSCSCISVDCSCKQKLTTSTSESILESNNQLLYRALEEMCKTVGQLSVQLKDLMCKMINSMQET